MTHPSVQELFKQGLAFYKSGNYDNAEEIFLQIVDQDENNHKTWNALGILYTKKKMLEEAEACFDNALFLYPLSEIYQKNKKISSNLIQKDKKIPVIPPEKKKKSVSFTFPFNIRQAAGVIGILILVIIILFAGLNLLSFSAQNAALIQTTQIVPAVSSSGSASSGQSGGVLDQISQIQVPGPGNSTISSLDPASALSTQPGVIPASSDRSQSGGILQNAKSVQVTAPDGSSLSLMDSASTMLSK